MRTLTILLAAASLMLLVALGGCGLLSGTVFVSEKVDDNIEAQSGSSADSRAGGVGHLDETFRGAKVDLRDNADWQDIDVDGIEDICVRLTVVNLLSTPISGQAWVTIGEDSTYTSIQQVQDAGGFLIFQGLAVAGDSTRIFPCSETLGIFENLDRLVDAVKNGVFWVWGRGDQDTYHFRYEAIYLGMHVTGSL
ncbi:hypothetical protein KKH27_03305 [bacterium]|nr:hypothetical protein [bacterium]MBU1983068.1 hypothetical protein [bacterium]